MKNVKIIRMKKCQVKQFNIADSVLCRGQALIIFLSRPHYLVGKDSRYQQATGMGSRFTGKKRAHCARDTFDQRDETDWRIVIG